MIPKRLFFVWLGTQPLPDFAARNIQGWRDLMPDWDVQLITDQNRPPTPWEGVYHGLQGVGLKSDVDRINVLHEYGGFYLDVDMIPVRSLTPVAEGCEASLAYTAHGGVETAYCAFSQGHPLAARFLQEFPTLLAAMPPGANKFDHIRATLGPWAFYIDDWVAPRLDHRVAGFTRPITQRGLTLLGWPSIHSTTVMTVDEALSHAPGGAAAPWPDLYAVHAWTGTWVAEAGCRKPEAEAGCCNKVNL